MKVLRPSLPPEILLERNFILSVLEKRLHEKLFISSANRLGKLPQMLPLCTPEYRQGYRQLLPFLPNKPFKQILSKSENFRSNFSECFTQGNFLVLPCRLHLSFIDSSFSVAAVCNAHSRLRWLRNNFTLWI